MSRPVSPSPGLLRLRAVSGSASSAIREKVRFAAVTACITTTSARALSIASTETAPLASLLDSEPHRTIHRRHLAALHRPLQHPAGADCSTSHRRPVSQDSASGLPYGATIYWGSTTDENALLARLRFLQSAANSLTTSFSKRLTSAVSAAAFCRKKIWPCRWTSATPRSGMDYFTAATMLTQSWGKRVCRSRT